MRRLVFSIAVAALLASSVIVEDPVLGAVDGSAFGDMADIEPPEIDDPISETEMQDLEALASQKDMSLQAAIERYAWNDNFALAVETIREAFPQAFTGAEIMDSENAWVAFADRAPEGARDIIQKFVSNHGITVDTRTGIGFTELELQGAIEEVHLAVLERDEVSDAWTSFDFQTSQIKTLVVLSNTVSDSFLNDLTVELTEELASTASPGLLNGVSVTVDRSSQKVIGGADSNTQHRGGEDITGCTSGFITRTSSGSRGISTAGHCDNNQSDDGVGLNFRAEYQGNHGDYQWHTGTQSTPDDYYGGSGTSTEVDNRDVSSIASPVVGQALCRNGIVSHKDCQEVRKLDVCTFSVCHLIQMEADLSSGGDSGGPVFWGNVAYGLHRGWMLDLTPRDTFSRANRIDEAIGVFIATS